MTVANYQGISQTDTYYYLPKVKSKCIILYLKANETQGHGKKTILSLIKLNLLQSPF